VSTHLLLNAIADAPSPHFFGRRRCSSSFKLSHEVALKMLLDE
jgi:hypothetical protein